MTPIRGLGLMSAFFLAGVGRVALAAPMVFEEVGGLVAVEAEGFSAQTRTDKRTWHLTSAKGKTTVAPDGDEPHVEGSSGGAYLELLPDTRRTHDDKLIQGENFTNEGGLQAVLTYKVHFSTPGRYYV